VTVVVPTRTAENGLGRVLDQLGPMVAQLRAEIIFVVDGHNGSFDSLVTTAPHVSGPGPGALPAPRAAPG
jgi:hypothetical protein